VLGDGHELARCGPADPYAIEQRLPFAMLDLFLGLSQMVASGDDALDRSANIGADDVGPLLDREAVAQRAGGGHLLKIAARGFKHGSERVPLNFDDLTHAVSAAARCFASHASSAIASRYRLRRRMTGGNPIAGSSAHRAIVLVDRPYRSATSRSGIRARCGGVGLGMGIPSSVFGHVPMFQNGVLARTVSDRCKLFSRVVRT
jgi:hypothetical protein